MTIDKPTEMPVRDGSILSQGTVDQILKSAWSGSGNTTPAVEKMSACPKAFPVVDLVVSDRGSGTPLPYPNQTDLTPTGSGDPHSNPYNYQDGSYYPPAS
jgi:hypothetical protein